MNAPSPTCVPLPATGVGTRRGFLAGAAAIVVIPIVGGLIANREWSRRRSVAGSGSSVMPGLEKFQPLIGTAFTTGDEPPLELTLVKAETCKFHQTGVIEQFSLRFSAPEGHPFESRIYQLHHPALGGLELFISPVGSAIKEGMQQRGEAVVNFAHRTL